MIIPFLLFLTASFSHLLAQIKVPKELLAQRTRTEIQEYSNKIALVNPCGVIVSFYTITGNKLIKTVLPKEISREELEDIFILECSFSNPEQQIILSYQDSIETRYWVKNGKLHQEVSKRPSVILSEKNLFALGYKHSLRIINNQNESCLVLQESSFKELENRQIRSLKESQKLVFADQKIQKKATELAQAAGLIRSVAVYQYTHSDAIEYLGMRPAIKFTLSEEETITTYSDNYLIVINKDDDEALIKAAIYHEMGHFSAHDIETKRDLLTKNPALWQERELAADEFAYSKLVEEGDTQALIQYCLYLGRQTWKDVAYDMLCSQDIHSQNYTKSNPEDTHPANWKRVQLCLKALDQLQTKKGSSLSRFITVHAEKACSKEITYALISIITQLFPEYASPAIIKQYKAMSLASGKASHVSVELDISAKDSPEIYKGYLFFKETYPELIQEYADRVIFCIPDRFFTDSSKSLPNDA